MHHEGADAHIPTEPVRVLDVANLGYGAVMCTIKGERVLLLDIGLSYEERLDVMVRAMAPAL